MSDMIVIKVS